MQGSYKYLFSAVLNDRCSDSIDRTTWRRYFETARLTKFDSISAKENQPETGDMDADDMNVAIDPTTVDPPHPALKALAWEKYQDEWFFQAGFVQASPILIKRLMLRTVIADIAGLAANSTLRESYLPAMSWDKINELVTQIPEEEFNAWSTAIANKDWEAALTPSTCFKLSGIYSHRH